MCHNHKVNARISFCPFIQKVLVMCYALTTKFVAIYINDAFFIGGVSLQMPKAISGHYPESCTGPDVLILDMYANILH